MQRLLKKTNDLKALRNSFQPQLQKRRDLYNDELNAVKREREREIFFFFFLIPTSKRQLHSKVTLLSNEVSLQQTELDQKTAAAELLV